MKAEFLRGLPLQLPAGEYYVGDPCYVYANGNDPDHEKAVVNHDRWAKEICAPLFAKDCDGLALGDSRDGVEYTTDEGVKFLIFGTANGDGCFQVRPGEGEVGVDAGLLSVIPWSLIEKWEGVDAAEALGVKLVFKKPFEAMAEAGDLTAGKYSIKTGVDDEDEDDWGSDDDGDADETEDDDGDEK